MKLLQQSIVSLCVITTIVCLSVFPVGCGGSVTPSDSAAPILEQPTSGSIPWSGDNQPTSPIQPEAPAEPAPSARFVVSMSGEIPIVDFRDGTITVGLDDFVDELKRRNQDAELTSGTSSTNPLELVYEEYDQSSGRDASWGFGRKIGERYIRVSLEKGDVGGCISRKTWHIGFMVSKQHVREPLINIHYCWWTENGTFCHGIYISGSLGNGYCRQSCSPPDQIITDNSPIFMDEKPSVDDFRRLFYEMRNDLSSSLQANNGMGSAMAVGVASTILIGAMALAL